MSAISYIAFLRLLVISFFFCSIYTCQKQTTLQTAKDVNAEILPYKLEITSSLSFPFQNGYFKIEDFEGDGISEVLQINRYADLNRATMPFITGMDILLQKTTFQYNFNGSIQAECLDVNDDGMQEILVFEQIENMIFLNILNHKGNQLKRFPIVTGEPRRNRPWVCAVRPAGMLDANDDGRQDLVLWVDTGLAYQPRGIWVYDCLTTKSIWSYRTGTRVLNTQISDLNNDGFSEILMRSDAPGNGWGEVINGTDDSHSYLMILDHKGRLLTCHSMGKEFSTVYPIAHNFDHSGTPEILVLKKSHAKQPHEKSLIGFWDFNKNRLYRQKEYDQEILDVTEFIDFDKDGIDEFLTFWINGQVEIRNVNNDVIQNYPLGERLHSDPIVEDLNSDGESEIILCTVSAVYVLSRKLDLLAKFPARSPDCQIIYNGQGKDRNLFVTSPDRWYRIEMRRNYAAPLRIAWPLVISFMAGGGIVLGIGLVIQYFRSKSLLLLANQAYFAYIDHGMMVVDKNGKLLRINSQAREILELHDALLEHASYNQAFKESRLADLRSLIKKSLADKVTFRRLQLVLHQGIRQRDILVHLKSIRDSGSRHQGLLVMLDDVSEMTHSRRAIAWAAVAQRLVHQMKTPLSSIMLAVQRLQMDYQRDIVPRSDAYDRYVDYVTGEVARIRSLTDGFLKLAQLENPALAPHDLNRIIQKCVASLEGQISPSIQIQIDFANDLPVIRVDENQILIALKVFMDNSIEAMDGSGKITISTRLAQSLQTNQSGQVSSSIRLEIADIGRGIPVEVQKKLFEPFYTTKNSGTGLGLTIARKIIEDHQGSIEIKSEAGMGTVVVVSLPVSGL